MTDQPLVECVPNFSEGRRADVVEQILAAIRSAPGVEVLRSEMDADHNRAVVTFVGPPEAVAEAAVRGARAAAALINLDEHAGQHPRIGATDVIPFVPLRAISLSDCVALARRVGQRLGEELGIPVYLYEAAATRPDRVNLADVRRGEYEGLRRDIGLPERAPDFGPARLGPAGATAVGARSLLVAYNVYLNTSDVEVAKGIARAVRFSGGGLRYVKALGLMVGGRAQVSMNLTDVTCTPLHRAFDMVRHEAERYGVTVTESEIIGLAPESALLDAAEHYLRLNTFERDQILDRRLAALDRTSPAGFVAGIAEATPTPAGGSVVALAASLGAALAEMMAGLTAGRKRYAAVEGEMRQALGEGGRLRAELLRLVDEDAAAFRAVMAAYRLPRATDEDAAAREVAIQQGLERAAESQLAVVEKAVETLRLLRHAAPLGNPNARPDAAVGALMAEAAVRGAALNVRVNARSLSDPARAQFFRAMVAAWEDEARRLAAEIVQFANDSTG
ncbi:MAG: glutamate formimidoyltransferase [Anaerolineae bacterium]